MNGFLRMRETRLGYKSNSEAFTELKSFKLKSIKQ